MVKEKDQCWGSVGTKKRCQVPYNLPEFPVPVADSQGHKVRYRPVDTCWCFEFILHHQICTSTATFGNPAGSHLLQGDHTILCIAYAGRRTTKHVDCLLVSKAVLFSTVFQHCWTVESCGTMLHQHEHRGSHDRKGLSGVAATDAGTVGVGCSSRRMRDSSFFVMF